MVSGVSDAADGLGVLQSNPLSGAFILAALLPSSLAYGLGCAVGTIIGTLAAMAGVHLDWLLMAAGLLRFATFIFIAMFYQYVWLMLVIGPVALVVIVGAMWLTRKVTHRHRGGPVAPH